MPYTTLFRSFRRVKCDEHEPEELPLRHPHGVRTPEEDEGEGKGEVARPEVHECGSEGFLRADRRLVSWVDRGLCDNRVRKEAPLRGEQEPRPHEEECGGCDHEEVPAAHPRVPPHEEIPEEE